MKAHRFITAIICGSIALCLFDGAALAARKSRNTSHVYVIRPPPLPQQNHPLIIAFKVKIKNGVVTRVENLRAALVVTVANSSSYGNDPDNPTIIDAGIQTSIIAPEEFRRLRFTIERGVDLSPDFEISGVLETIDDEDPSNPKTIELKSENFQIVK